MDEPDKADPDRMADVGEDPDADLVSAAISRRSRRLRRTARSRHYDRIHGLAWQLTGTRADADDIAQTVCCTLVEKIATFRGEAKFTTWLCGIVYNACRDLRDRRRRSFSSFAERLSAVLTGCWRASAPDGRDLYDAIWLKSGDRSAQAALS